jgi:3-oxoacyl-[acyl-carrier protein] reductase
MDLGIEGKVAMVAASSKGIGFAISKALAAEGCRLSLCSRDESALAAACAQIGNARGYVCDVAQAGRLERWMEDTCSELGEPSILITNSGGPPPGRLSELSDAQWQSGFDSTILCAVRLFRLAAPKMQRAGWGRIVHVSSFVAKDPLASLPISSTLRSGLVALTRLQAEEVAADGVTVNAVLPGHTLTDRQRELARIRATKEGVSLEEALARQASEVPARRLATPEEIAAATLFLCSEGASYVSGVSLLADGALARGLG